MKENKRLKEILVFLIILLIPLICSSFFYNVYAENETEEILKNQSDSIGIASFIEEANKYKNKEFDINIEQIISSAIKGNIDNKTLGKEILSILFGQVEESSSTIR